jgi:hypothetical protein
MRAALNSVNVSSALGMHGMPARTRRSTDADAINFSNAKKKSTCDVMPLHHEMPLPKIDGTLHIVQNIGEATPSSFSSINAMHRV